MPLQPVPPDAPIGSPSTAYEVAVHLSRALPWKPDYQHESMGIMWWNGEGSTHAALPAEEEMEVLMVAKQVIEARMVKLDAVMSGVK